MFYRLAYKKYGITYRAFTQKPDIIQKTYIYEYTTDTGNNFVAVERFWKHLEVLLKTLMWILYLYKADNYEVF